ncbi:MAG: Xaa-Pro dipeptidase [Gammaproteobacteria bacterium]
MTELNTLFESHIHNLQGNYARAMDTASVEAVLLHSGSEQVYFGDDRHIPFQSYGHFHHWLPVNRPDQLLLIKPGETPVYFQVIPDDFWYDQAIDNADWWAGSFDIRRLGKLSQLATQLPDSGLAYLGPSEALAQTLGVNANLINPPALLHYLDFHRACKTEYEVVQLREANRRGLTGHAAARRCFLEGGNEFEIHRAFCEASAQLEAETPYTNIVALDEKAAILHYQHKRRDPAQHSKVLLIDAGCRVNGYGSDITRTTVKPGTEPLFMELLAGMEAIELALVEEVKPGIPYPDLHISALARLTALLVDKGICTGTADDLLAAGIPQLFMPHGVGHLLGIQVHDVGGHQASIDGARSAPPEHSPALRTTRTLVENMVFTIEPGCYFIPMLLEPERATARGRHINWSSVDRLYPCGGIRIEDNVRVTADGAENLTRQFEQGSAIRRSGRH